MNTKDDYRRMAALIDELLCAGYADDAYRLIQSRQRDLEALQEYLTDYADRMP